MKVAMMQPAFMPWQGFFELIASADVFIFLDDFQFSSQSYQQRNRLFVNRGQVDWYTVPIEKSSFREPLNRARINETVHWRPRMLKRLQQNYSKAPYFKDIFPSLENWLMQEAVSLAEQNMELIFILCKHLGLTPEFRRSSQLGSRAERSERVLELLRWSGASSYYCARGSFPYMATDGVFPASSVKVLFQNFQPKPYRQVGGQEGFMPFLSVVDALLNVGSVATAELVQTGTGHWNSWDEMMQLAAGNRDDRKEAQLVDHAT